MAIVTLDLALAGLSWGPLGWDSLGVGRVLRPGTRGVAQSFAVRVSRLGLELGCGSLELTA